MAVATHLFEILSSETSLPKILVELRVLVPPPRPPTSPLGAAPTLNILPFQVFRLQRVYSPTADTDRNEPVAHLPHYNAPIRTASDCRTHSRQLRLPIWADLICARRQRVRQAGGFSDEPMVTTSGLSAPKLLRRRCRAAVGELCWPPGVVHDGAGYVSAEAVQLWPMKGTKATDVSFTIDPGAPWRRGVNDTKVLLHTIWAGRWFRDKMCGGGICSLYLNEAFRADSLVTAARMVDIRGVVLDRGSLRDIAV